LSSEGWLKLDFDRHVLVHAPALDRSVTKINELVRELKQEGAIAAADVPGRMFGAAANPVLRLPKPKT
jgi:hypothetical protein